MDSPASSMSPEPSSSMSDITKNTLIIILLVILLLSLLGINIFTIFGNTLQNFINIFNPIVSKGLSELGFASGTIIDKSADIVSDASKTGIDILHGTADSVGDLLIKASGNTPDNNLDRNINQPPTTAPNQPEPNDTTSPIQTNSQKSSWCLVGEYNGARGCVSITEQDKCLSGQVFPSQQVCLNPTLTQNQS